MGRSELREHIFKMLFRIEFNIKDDMPEQMSLYLDYLRNKKEENEEEIKEEDMMYIQEKYMAVMERLEEIDGLLNEYTTGWTTGRMNKVDLTILRLGVYEMRWDDTIPIGVAINEAVELSKKYSSDDGPSFVNGVLAKLIN
ncbi:MAG: transcription antitermination factor NusB [Lachnospiraceae bacterium]